MPESCLPEQAGRRHALRLFAGVLTATLLPPRGARADDDPVAIVVAIYAPYTKPSAKPGAQTTMASAEHRKRMNVFSATLLRDWAKADARTQEEGFATVDFDLPSNSQDPDIKSVALKVERLDEARAVIAATLTPRRGKPRKGDGIVRYDFIRENGGWKIDDIRGKSSGEPWGLREIVAEALKVR